MKCEKCGAVMFEYREGHSYGYTCPNCGWGLATTFYEPYETDTIKYSIIIYGNEATGAAIKVISTIAGVNYLQANKLLRQSEAIVFEGCASEILEKKMVLIENNISFKITPDFPY